MSAIWSFAAFDWNSYRELSETLVQDNIPIHDYVPAPEKSKDSLESKELTALEIEEARIRGLVHIGLMKACERKGLDVDELSTTELGSSIVYDTCCLGTVLQFEGRFAETIKAIRTRPHGYEVAEMITEAMSLQAGTESWWRADDGICGVLSPQQTSDLAVHLLLLQRNTPLRTDSGPLNFLNWRLNATRAVDGLIHDLTDVVTEAAEHLRGLAILRQL